MAQINLSTIFLNTAVASMDAAGGIKAAGSSEAFSKTLSKTANTNNAIASVKSSRKDDALQPKNNSIQSDKPKNPSTSIEKNKAVKDAAIKNEKIAAEKEADEKAEEVKAQNPDDQIVALISQSLGLTAEEIKDILDQLGMQPGELLNGEGFSVFIGQALGGGDINRLLTGEIDLKQVNELFQELSQLNMAAVEDNTMGSSSVLNLRTALQETSKTQTIVEEQHLQPGWQGAAENIQAGIGPVRFTGSEGQNQQNGAQMEQGMMSDANQNAVSQPGGSFTATSMPNTFSHTIQHAEKMAIQSATAEQSVDLKGVLDQVNYKILGQTKELSIQLSPKELGTMNIRIVETNGALVAEINVENEKIKDLIQNEIAVLKENLEEQGLSVTDVRVDIKQGNGQSQMEQGRQKSSKRIQEIISAQYGEEEIQEDEMTQPDLGSESEVDYMI